MFLNPFSPGRRTERVLRAHAESMRDALRTITAYTPPPPTRGQRIAAWLDRYVLPPLGQILTVGGLAYIAHLGWRLAG